MKRALSIAALAAAASASAQGEDFKKHEYLQAYVSCFTWTQSREKLPELHHEISRWIVEVMRGSTPSKLSHLNDTTLIVATALECSEHPGDALNKAVFAAMLSLPQPRR